MRENASIGRLFILVFVLFLILPLACVMFFFLSKTYESTEKSSRQEIEIIAHASSGKINTNLENPARYITTLADLLSKGLDQETLAKLIDSGIKNFQIFDTLYLLDEDRRVKIIDFGFFRKFNKDDFIDIKLGDVGENGGFGLSWSKPFLSPITGGYVVRVSAKSPKGFIVGDINLKFLGDALRNVKRSKTSMIFIVDSGGEVISSGNREFSLSYENREGHPLVKNRFMGNYSSSSYIQRDIKLAGSIYRIPIADWYLVYEEPHSEAFSSFHDMLIVVLVSFGTIFLFVAMVLSFMNRRLIVPLKLLTERSGEIALGNFPEFSDSDKNVFYELKVLYDGFEKMSLTIDRRERELRDKEEYLRSIFDSTTNTGIFVVSLDSEPVITDVNMGAQIILGYRMSELLGLPVSALVKNIGEDFTRMQKECLKRNTLLSERIGMTRKSGADFPALISVQPLSNASGEVTAVIAVLVDITEITQVQSELEGEKERLDVTLKSIGEGVIAADRFGKITLANSSAERILGCEYRYLSGSDIKDTLQIYEYDTGEALSGKISDFSNISNMTYRANLVTRDSGTLVVFITCSAMMNHKGDLLGFVYVFRDITERMRMERELIKGKQELEEVNKGLEHRVTEETNKRRKNEQMLFEQAKFAAMGQMISAIAHQWRQPLNALALYIQDIEDSYELEELDAEYIESFNDSSMKLINHMSETIDDFRNFFHSSNVPERVDISKVVFDSLSLVATQLRNQMIGYEVVIRYDGNRDEFIDSIPAEYDAVSDKEFLVFPSELKQVLLNIVQNARDAIVERRKTGCDRSGSISFLVDYKSDRVLIEISNDGDNIPKDTLSRIFDPYFTTKSEGEGTGIGLYMSKIMVEDHMGGLLVAENIEGGVKFIITLEYSDDSDDQ